MTQVVRVLSWAADDAADPRSRRTTEESGALPGRADRAEQVQRLVRFLAGMPAFNWSWVTVDGTEIEPSVAMASLQADWHSLSMGIRGEDSGQPTTAIAWIAVELPDTVSIAVDTPGGDSTADARLARQVFLQLGDVIETHLTQYADTHNEVHLTASETIDLGIPRSERATPQSPSPAAAAAAVAAADNSPAPMAVQPSQRRGVLIASAIAVLACLVLVLLLVLSNS